MMRGHHLIAACVALFLALGLSFRVHSQESAPPPPAPNSSDIDNDTVFRVNVDMVQLNVAVTDKKGNYITSLKPSDFEIVEDGIVEKAATFGEGNEPVRNLGDVASPDASPDGNRSGQALLNGSPQSFHDLVNGANVFILFDTSDYMYRG